MQFAVIRRLAERHLVERFPWLGDVIDESTWHSEPILTAGVRAKAGPGRRRRLHGHFDGRPGGPDALLIRAQLVLWSDGGWPFDFAVIARDCDGEIERRRGAEQALSEHARAKPVVLAYAEPEIEAWLIAGFEPRSDTESAKLDALRKRLGFDPQRSPEHLTSRRQTDRRDAKRALHDLLDGNSNADERCTDADESTWMVRTHASGGADFLRDLADLVRSL